ncbi:hypothetical protein INS49_012225 [Diaporthe citri]|uniref:uncharacterized protein n=1 Tax=Diaporthe citri TaxID=83186 RepID=UPI001C81B432|nr:uncharacterized protein INS49_012225 [Diaporthe citri]KAG6358707.1 hypothetical protein INS49_012225 [Diaporthe citri]
MDPMTVLSIAAAVVQFVDFGTSLFSGAREMYKSASGQPQDIIQLTTLVYDLSQFSKSIQEASDKAKSTQKSYDLTEENLCRVCANCLQTCTEIQAAVSSLGRVKSPKSAVPNSIFGRQIDATRAFQSIEIALKNLASSKQIRAWQDQLRQSREQIMKALLNVLWSQSKTQTVTLENISQRQISADRTLGHIREDTMLLRQQLGKTSKLWPLPLPRGSATVSMEPQEFDEKSCTEAIIDSLKVHHIDQRERAIPKAYEKTFEWIFTETKASNGRVLPLPQFDSWLEGPSSDIYWISGKAGAGKSTMMEYILHHPLTREKITKWNEVTARQLLWGSFFFWNAGNAIQKSKEGLLRALLFQFIEQEPDILRQICPRRWALCKALGPGSITSAPDWQWEELLEAFSLFSLLLGDRFNLFLLIDGLDEFEGDHEKLIEFIEALHLRNGTKICVSSRPWNTFTDTFHNNYTLKMDQVTAGDIYLYAQGVFLWVSVVVAQIRLGLSEGDKVSDLQAVLEDIPKDLSSIYDSIWRRIKPSYAHNSSQIFQIHQCAIDSNERIEALLLYLADEELSTQDEDISAFMGTRRKHVTQIVKRMLDSRTRGLLEVDKDGYVTYLHRTVREWIEPKWPEICSRASSDFEPHLALLRALATYRSASEKWTIGRYDTLIETTWLILSRCFNHSIRVRDNHATIDTLVQLLDSLDLYMTRIWATHPGKMTTSVGETELDFMLRRYNEYHSTALESHAMFGQRKESVWGRAWIPDIHYLQTPFLDTQFTQSNVNFVGLATQFGLKSYVRLKYRADEELFRPLAPALLSCAVLGFQYFCREPGVRRSFERLIGDRSTFHGRKELVKFILEDVDPKSAFQSGMLADSKFDTIGRVVSWRTHR